MMKDVWFRGAATCMGPRERYSPGPSLTLNGPVHRNIMTVSKTPVNTHDIVSNTLLSLEDYQIRLASVNFLKIFPTHDSTQPTKRLNFLTQPDPTISNP